METSHAKKSDLTKLAANLPGVVFIVTVKPDGSIHLDFVCDDTKSVIGFDPVSLEHDPSMLFEIISPDELREIKKLIRNSFRTPRKISREIPIVKKNGERRWLRIEATPRARQGLEGFEWFGVALDVTDAKEREKQITEIRSLLESIFSSIEDAIFLIGPPHRHVVKSANSAVEKIFGYRPEELEGQSTEKLHENDESFQEFGRRTEKVLQTGQSFRGEYRMRRRNGEIFPTEHTIMALHAESGWQEGVVSVVRDISDRKKADKERQKLQARLQQAQKMESIGTLAGGIAHDFNNILMAIIGYTKLASEDTAAIPEVQEKLQEVISAADRAKGLIHQILTFSRQADGGKRAALQVSLLVKEVVKMLRATMPSFIRIEERIRSHGLVMANPAQLNQVIMNLCTNAYHAMKKQGGVLTVELSKVELRLGDIHRRPELAAGNYLRLAVSDTGIGMDDATVKKIFDPYFTTKGPGEGTGLGLSLVYRIVRLLNGVVEVDSQWEKGTTFTVFLPEVDRKDSPEEIAEAPSALKGSEKILFVDDEQSIAQLGVKMLERMGYHVESQTSSVEALRRFEENPDNFDLVITDMMMPQMTGEHLAKNILRIRPDMPIVLCTGYSELIDREKAASMGIRAMLMKPVLNTELARVVRKVLDNSDSENSS